MVTMTIKHTFSSSQRELHSLNADSVGIEKRQVLLGSFIH